MAATQTRPSFIREDGTFIVKSGDMISKYCMTMYGNYGSKTTTWPKFFRFDKQDNPKTIDDYNLIYAGEKLGHWDYYKAKPGKGGGGGQPGTNPGGGQAGGGQPGGGGGTSVSFEAPKLKIPFKDPKEVGYFAFQLEVSAKGTVGPKNATRHIDIVNELPSLEREIPLNFGQQFETSIGLSLGLDQIKTIQEGCKTADPDKFREAMQSTVQLKATTNKHPLWRNFMWQGEASLHPTMTPVEIAFTVSTSGEVTVNGVVYTYEAEVTAKLCLGLSKRGWVELSTRVGKPLVRAVTQLIGPELAAACSYWCGFVLLAVGATVLTQQLFEWLIGNAVEAGKKTGYASWYARAYVNAVFYEAVADLGPYPTPGGKEMTETAMRDVISDMQGPEVGLTVTGLGPVPNYDAIPSGYWKPARNELKAYRNMLIGAAGDSATAETRLWNAANERALRRLNS